MTKYYLNETDLKELIKESHELPVSSKAQVALDISGSDKLVATYVTKDGDKSLIDLTEVRNKRAKFQGSITRLGEVKTTTFTGELYNDSLSNKRTSPKKVKFNLRRNIVNMLNNIQRQIKLKQINQGEFIYEFDKLGRLYLPGEKGNIFYADRSLSVYLGNDGKYYNLIKENNDYFFQYNPHIHYDYFDYYYLTKRDFQNDKIITPPNDFYLNPFTNPTLTNRNKVIDIRPYLHNRTH